jgi:hypothetical protein
MCARAADWPWSNALAYEDRPTLIPVDKCRWFINLGEPENFDTF